MDLKLQKELDGSVKKLHPAVKKMIPPLM